MNKPSVLSVAERDLRLSHVTARPCMLLASLHLYPHALEIHLHLNTNLDLRILNFHITRLSLEEVLRAT